MQIRSKQFERYGYLIAAGCTLLATLLFLPGREYFAKGQWALLYLLMIGLVAGVCGVRAALLAAVLAFIAWNYFFLPPYNTMRIEDPKDWLALLVFLAVGLIIGVQTGRMHDREAQALSRERETALLNHISASLVSITDSRSMAETLLSEITRLTMAPDVSLWLPDSAGRLQLFHRVAQDGHIADEQASLYASWCFQQSKAVGLPPLPPPTLMRAEGWPISVPHQTVFSGAVPRGIFIPLQTTNNLEGVLQIDIMPQHDADACYIAQLLVSIANLASVFLERQRLYTTACQAEALVAADRLKSTFVSSVSHELKTPLSALTATITNLLAEDVPWEIAQMREELQHAQTDLGRLQDSIGALLDFARLESEEWKPQFDWYELGDVLGSVLEKLSAAERARIIITVPNDFPAFYVDCAQLSRVMQHLFENALSYSPPASSVLLGGQATVREVRLWVEDCGPGIPPSERSSIFDKFFRGSTSSSTPAGTGLGLAIAAEIVRFHQGRLWVEDVQPHGARFVLALPRLRPTENKT